MWALAFELVLICLTIFIVGVCMSCGRGLVDKIYREWKCVVCCFRDKKTDFKTKGGILANLPISLRSLKPNIRGVLGLWEFDLAGEQYSIIT